MKTVKISSSGSIYIRALLKDCGGTAVEPSDVASITLNIFEELIPENIVTDYTNLSVPASAVLASVQTDENNNEYNVSFNPYISGKPMFPKRQTSYIVEVIFTDANGRPSAHQIRVNTQ